jgi:FkbM family methyltransferase
MPFISARKLSRVASAAWRHAPAPRLEAWLFRAQQAIGILRGYGFECLEHEVTAASSLLPPGPAVICDAGANKGDWSRGVLERRKGVGDRFFLFEPSRMNISVLHTLSIPQFTIVPVALSNSAGRVPLYGDAAGSGLGSLHQRDLTFLGIDHTKQEAVTTITLDEFAHRNDITRIDYLKLDVEGHELAVLRGAGRLLEKRAITAIAFEFGGTQIDSRAFFRDYWNLLVSHGYRLHRVVPGGLLLPIKQYDIGFEVFQLTTYVAVTESR